MARGHNVQTQVFFTSLTDCVRWSNLLIFAALAVQSIVSEAALAVHRLPSTMSWRLAVTLLGVSIALGTALGVLLFLVGWWGRTTISSEGVGGSRYWGLRDFVAWSDIREVTRYSSNGWPMLRIQRHSGRAAVYVMVIGKQKQRLRAAVATLSPFRNPLSDWLQRPDA